MSLPNDTYFISSYVGGAYLEVVNGDQEAGITTGTFTGDLKQQWCLESYSGTYTIKNVFYRSYISLSGLGGGTGDLRYLASSFQPFAWHALAVDGSFAVAPASIPTMFWSTANRDLRESDQITLSAIEELWVFTAPHQREGFVPDSSILRDSQRSSTTVSVFSRMSDPGATTHSAGNKDLKIILPSVLGGVLVLGVILWIWRVYRDRERKRLRTSRGDLPLQNGRSAGDNAGDSRAPRGNGSTA